MSNLIFISNLTDGGIEDLLNISAAGPDGNADLTEGIKSNADALAVADLIERRSAIRPSLHWLKLYRKG